MRRWLARLLSLFSERGAAVRKPVVEEMEPRILYSADANPLLWAGADPNASAIVAPVSTDAGAQTVAAPTQQERRREIVFVDAAVPDAQRLIDGIRGQRGDGVDIEVVQLSADANGLRQIGDVLAGERNLDAVHIVSHGGAGRIQLGATVVDAQALDASAGTVARWSQALSGDADILIYGCDVASTAQGRQLIAELAALTGADVAASDDPTGHEALGGDWSLEVATGAIEAEVAFDAAFRAEWMRLLPTYQEFINYTASLEIKSDANHGQTFTHNSGAGTYVVNQISLALSRDSGASAQNITVTLRSSWNGAVLGSATIASSSIGTSAGWVDFNFADVSLNDNTSYTIRLTSSTTDGKVYAGFNSSGGYANGNRIDTSGSPLSSEDVAFRVSHVTTNAAPVLDATKSPALSAVAEDAGAPVGAVGTLVSALVDFASPAGEVDNVTDSNSGALLGIAVTAADTSNGTWWYSTNGGSSWSALGSPSSASARLLAADADNRLYFQPNANYNGTLANAITFRAWDRTSGADGGTANTSTNGGSTAFSIATDTASLTVTAVNDAPAVTATGTTLAYTENGAATAIDSGLTVTDVDSANLSSATISMSSGFASGQDVLAFTNQLGISGSWDAGAGVLTLTGSATVANYQTALRSITYVNTSDNPSPATRTVSFVVNDGSVNSNTGARSISVAAVNDAPVIADLAGDAPAYVEGSGAVVVDQGSAATLTDIDSFDFSTGTLTVSLPAGSDIAEDVLSIRNQGTAAGQIGTSGGNSNVTYGGVVIGTFSGGANGTPLVVTFNASATPAAAEALLRNITFCDTDGHAPTAGARVVRFVLTDGDGGSSGNHDATVTVAAVNDAPRLLGPELVVNGNFSTDISGWSTTGTVSHQAGGLRFGVTNALGPHTASQSVATVAGQTYRLTFDYRDDDTTWNQSLRVTVNGSSVLLDSGHVVTDKAGNTFVRYDYSFVADSSSATITFTDTSDTAGLSRGSSGVDGYIDNVSVRQSGGPIGSAAYTENGAAVVLDADVSVFDAELSAVNNFAGATLTLSRNGGANAQDQFSATGLLGPLTQGGALIYNGTTIGSVTTNSGGTLALTFNASATQANLDSAVRQIAYGNTSDTPPAGVQIDWLFSDGNAGAQGSGGAMTASGSTNVSITAVNDAPVVASNGGGATAAVSVAENQTAVTTVTSTDVDGGTPTYTIGGGADAARFTIDASSGLLTFNAAPNFEAPTDAGGNNVYEVTVQVADGNGGTDTQSIAVAVTNVNDAPVITSSATASVAENQAAAVTVTSTDVDGGAPTYSIVGGADQSLFSIDSATGVLTFNAAPNFEAPGDAGSNNVYDVTVQVSDGNGGTATQAIAVTVTNVNEAPVIASSAAATVAENHTGAITVTSTDVDGGAPSYSIVGGADQALFSIDSTTGVLTFNSAPDFESPSDAGGNNVYDVQVQVADGNGGTVTQAIAVTVTNVNDAPVITSHGGGATGGVNVAENLTAVGSVTSSDVDGGVAVFSLAGGADAARFAIDSATGALSFVAAPDFEAPSDANADNVYEVTVQVADGNGGFDTQALAVTVSDVASTLQVTTTSDAADSGISAGNAAHTAEWLNANLGADSAISLREAIIAANNTAGADTITFNLAGSGVQTINVAAALPAITGAVLIDGWSQAGFSGTPLIELTGNYAGSSVEGLSLGAGSDGSTVRGLIVNRFTGNGIEINGSGGHTLQGNWIGLDATGAAAAANVENGIFATASSGNLIGGATAAERNVVSGNGYRGIFFVDVDGSAITGNFIGTDASGAMDVSGTAVNLNQSGIVLSTGSDGNVIGGTTAAARNVISGNNHFGVEFQFGSQNNRLEGNFIGATVTGLSALGNLSGGVSYWSAGSGNVTGGGAAGAGNVISGNGGMGVLVGNASNGAVIQGNVIGLGVDGDTVLANGGSGVVVRDASTNTLLGTDGNGANDAAERNLIAGNLNDGISIDGVGATGTVVAGNFIGTDASGTAARGNAGNGVSIGAGAQSNTIGGSAASQRNVVSGNDGYGIVLNGAATSGNVVRGNYLGVNAVGSAAVGNGASGIGVFNGASGNTIGGMAAGAGNLISGNGDNGVLLAGAGVSNNVVQGNAIGIDAAGTATLGNGAQGVWIGNGATNNTVGGSAAGAGNVIGGNTYAGVELRYAGTSGNRVQGNFIGTDASGTLAFANGGAGVLIQEDASGNLIGGALAGEGNTIRFNRSAGIVVNGNASTGNALLGNSIGGNALLGIDLGNYDGVTPNDAGDADSGANNRQNFPVLTSAASIGGGQVRIDMTLDSLPSGAYRIEFFASSAADASGYGEGQRFLGHADVTTDGSGAGSVQFVGSGVAAGEYIGATATDASNNTSEISFARQVVAPAIVVTPVSGLVTTEAGGSATFSVVLTTRPSADVVIDLASSDATEGSLSASSLTFTSANWNVAQTVTVTGVQDFVNDGAVAYTVVTGAAVSSDASYNGLNASDVALVNNESANTAPVNNVQGAQTVAEDTALVFSAANGNAITVGDADAGANAVRVTLTATNGAFGLSGVTGLTFVSGDGTADATMTFSGSLADINAALDGLAFTPTANFSGAASLAIASDDQGNSGSGGALSDSDTVSINVTAVNDAPSGAPVVTGSATEDATLAVDTSSIADVDGLGAFSYRWQRDGVAIAGATGSTFTLGDAEVGSSISVVVSYTDGSGTAESLTSAAVGPIVNVNDAPSGAPAITGTATEDQTLAADTSSIADADGLGAFSYQWQRNGIAIVGATASTYTLGDVDVGASIGVVVGYTDGHGAVEALTSAVVGPIANVNDAPLITSNGGGASASLAIAENESVVTTVVGSDVDGAAPSYSIVGGADAARFAIDVASGDLRFTAAPDFEAPSDADRDNVYELTVQVADGNSGTATQSIAVAVAGANEAPGNIVPSSASLAEQASAGTVVAIVTASDPDAGDLFTFTLVTDGAGRFVIDPASGRLTVAPGAMLDFESAPSHTLVVRVTDAQGLRTEQTIVVTLRDAIETLPDVTPAPAPAPAPAPSPAPAPAPAPASAPAPAPAPSATPTPAPSDGQGNGEDRDVATPRVDAVRRGPGTDASLGTVSAQAADTSTQPQRQRFAADSAPVVVASVAFAFEGSAVVFDAGPTSIGNSLTPQQADGALQRLALAALRTLSLDGDPTEQALPQRNDEESQAALTALQDPVRVASVTLTAGFVWWLTRSGGLLTSILMGIPAWRHVDLLPALAPGRDDDEEEDDQGADAEQDESEPSRRDSQIDDLFSNTSRMFGESRPLQ